MKSLEMNEFIERIDEMLRIAVEEGDQLRRGRWQLSHLSQPDLRGGAAHPGQCDQYCCVVAWFGGQCERVSQRTGYAQSSSIIDARNH